MSKPSDEAARKELTVGMVERIIRLRFKKHGDDARLDNILAQFRSAAIQECADAVRRASQVNVSELVRTAIEGIEALKER